jgi:hypothetical protein
MTSFFDQFTASQTRTDSAYTPGDLYSGTFVGNMGVNPTPVTRQLVVDILIDSPTVVNDVNAGSWTVSLTPSQIGTEGRCNYFIQYLFATQPGNQPPYADFSQIAGFTITQTFLGPVLIPLIGMQLEDSSANLSPSVGGTLDPLTHITTWPISSFTGVNLSSIFVLFIGLPLDATLPISAQFGNFMSIPVCVAKDTNILMSDQSLKFIQDVQREDLVAGDLQCSLIHQVARLNHQQLALAHPTNLLTFDTHCLGINQPDKPLIVTENHPIIYQNARRPAYCFKELPGVTYHQKIPAGQILPHDDDDDDSSCTVYDLQFDHDGTYVANGVVVQSRSPYSQLTPLPRELYFDQSLCTDERVSDAYDHVLPLDCSILTTI